MDTVRSYLAVLLVVLVPPIMVFWCVVHPLAPVWRRVGPWVGYFALLGIVCVLGWGFFLLREVADGTGSRYPSATAGLGTSTLFDLDIA